MGETCLSVLILNRPRHYIHHLLTYSLMATVVYQYHASEFSVFSYLLRLILICITDFIKLFTDILCYRTF